MTCRSFAFQRLSTLGLAAALLVFPAVGAAAQVQNEPPLPGTRHDVGPDRAWEEQQRKQMEKKANLQRQQDIRKDTEKLLELATELKQNVDKSNENTLSLEVIKKAEQIEKLAKTIREKMKGP